MVVNEQLVLQSSAASSYAGGAHSQAGMYCSAQCDRLQATHVPVFNFFDDDFVQICVFRNGYRSQRTADFSEQPHSENGS